MIASETRLGDYSIHLDGRLRSASERLGHNPCHQCGYKWKILLLAEHAAVAVLDK
jgi:hypothetical protein